ncbi:MAG: NAD(P)H-dependent oxidoreductase [Alphaproteobacteria bacterium]|nr:NAD(P)H-dependent oxidoreductase [Alphaproteobacteria bacterium]
MAFKTAIIVGSLRKESINLKLAKALAKLGEGKFTVEYPSIDLPVFNQDMEENFPAIVTAFKKPIDEADAVLFVTPEYNRSIPGPLKNAIDWASRPYGKNSFTGKIAATVGASGGALGTACAQQMLKQILVYFNMQVIGQPEVYLHYKDGMFDADSNITDEGTKKFLTSFVEKFTAFAEKRLAK